MTGRGGNIVLLEKMLPAEVQADGNFDYKIRVTNLTEQTLTNVMVKDHLPENMTINTSVPEITQMMEKTAYWNLGTLEPKASKTITSTAVAKGKGEIRTCAEVSYDIPICAITTIVEPKLRLAKTAPAEVLACDRIELRYEITNTGTGTACGIKIKDMLSESLMTAEGGRDVMFELEHLLPGQTRQFSKMVDASKAGSFTGKAMAESDNSGTVSSNSTTTNVRKPVLQINESCPSSQYTDRTISYDVTVTNKGDGVAKDTKVEVMVPEQLAFESASDNGLFTRTSPGRIVWDIGSLRPDDQRKLSFGLKGRQAGSFTTKATANAFCAETASDTCQTILSGISAILLEVVDVTDPIEVGRSVQYIITVTNQGSAPGTNIRLSCMLEESMEYISSKGPTQASVEEKTIKFEPLESLAAGAKATWMVNIRALRPTDVRFKVMLKSDQFERFVEETEATTFYE
jgi:uncharacterized repeat protein (TIGR01451 family)